ncbi:MAG TPA: serine hydrolase domain-containing protein [Vicinamibacterales bacterium]|nr:serine hydrolase domain-containing protein [Vicinamibacterales bacterium]
MKHTPSRMRRLLVFTISAIFALAGLLGVSLYAATATARPDDVGLSAERLKRVTELMQRHIDAKTFSGAVTLIARNGRIAHFEAQGLMDVESKKPMQKDTIFRIMSMTKPVVGVAVMMLVEDGKVRLTDPVGRFIPELQNLKVTALNTDGVAQPANAIAAPMPTRTVDAVRPITVRDLLTHTSGLTSGGASAAQLSQVPIGAGESLSVVMPRLKNVPLDFQPGTRWAYSAQYGFDVLARVVEVASGMPFDRFAKQRIFDPLAMKDTFFYPATGNPRIATLYQSVDGQLRKQADGAWVNGAYFSGGGGLFSTAEDYLQFAMMLMNGGQLDGRRVLSTRTVDLMASAFAPDTLPGRAAGEAWGLSMRVITDPALRNTFLSKGSFGWSGAYNTHFFIDPKEKIIGIYMTQSAYLETRAQMREDFETAVMQSIVGGTSVQTGTN